MGILKVELTEDVAEGGRSLAKEIAAARERGVHPNSPEYPRLKVTNSPKGVLKFRKGVVITMESSGAEKWIGRGIAKPTDQAATTPVRAKAA